MAIVYFINFAVTKFFGQSQTKQVPKFEEAGSTSGIVQDYNPIPQSIAPIWPMNSSLDVKIYISPSLAMPAFHHIPNERLVLDEQAFKLGDWGDKRVIDTEFGVPKEVQHNQTLWAHIYVALHGHELDPAGPDYSVRTAYHFFRPLNHFLAKKKVTKTKKLLGGGEQEDEVADGVAQKGPLIASYFHSNFTMSLIPDSGVLKFSQVHPAVRQYMVLESTGARDASGQNGWYYPIMFVNTFWQLRDHMTELNATVRTLPLHIDLNNLNNWKFGIYASLDESIKQNQKNIANGGPVPAGGDGSEFEEFKRILIDTNIYLLSTTAIVTVLHTIFEFLAFKNDVVSLIISRLDRVPRFKSLFYNILTNRTQSHWRKKKDNVGISFRTILANVAMQSIIFLYLLDNSDGTSWMILVGQGMGILIEAWKITKTVDVRLRATPEGSLLPYTIVFEDKHVLSDTEKKTQEYDQIAFRYLYMVAVPLLIAYAAYSVLYEEHKGWYSFILTTLVGSVYAYGFLMMVPSLYINYRLKSVAHMPARAMTYKFLNTFIDDLFAFTIKMPTLHRLATLRDDVIFFVYLYQAWVYKVDYSRVNEFGQGGDDEGENTETKKEGREKAEKAETAKAITEKANGETTGAEKTDGEGRKRR